MINSFQLDPILERDSLFIADLELCHVRLINNSDFPWLIFIPRKSGIVEIMDLSEDEYIQMNKEIMNMATKFKKETGADKLNIATIGNVVSQMHVHIVARKKNDKLFPSPVWGNKLTPYDAKDSKCLVEAYKKMTLV